MGLLKEKKKLGGTGRPGLPGTGRKAETSDLRPRYVDKRPPCEAGCPGASGIREALAAIAQADKRGLDAERALDEAWQAIAARNPFPAVTGRVCPHPCEAECNRAAKEGAVAINAIERFLGDHGIRRRLAPRMVTEEKRSGKVAVIGSGPAGLSAAYHLARRGYGVTVFEAAPAAGGMLRSGIPAYRLPREVLDAEIGRIAGLGIEMRTGARVGRDVSWEEIESGSAAIFVAIGAQRSRRLGVDGEDAAGVIHGLAFLAAVSSGAAPEIGGKVVVVGGGSTAIDAARTARRLGAAEVTVLYRRTRAEMPAAAREIDEAIEEGIRIEILAAPERIVARDGRAIGIECVRMALGDPDASGRPRPVPVEGSTFEIPASAVIPAVGQEVDLAGLGALGGSPSIAVDGEGRVQGTKVWAGGDAVGIGLVTVAIAQGRIAAEAIDRHLRGDAAARPADPPVVAKERIMLDWYEPAARCAAPVVPAADRLSGPKDVEVVGTITEAQARAEAKRCMSCGACIGCENCWKYCQDSAVIRPARPGERFAFKLEFCQGCKKCAENCPTGHVDMI